MVLLTAGRADALSSLSEGFTGAVNGPVYVAPFVWSRRLKMSERRERRSGPCTWTAEGLRSPPPVSGPRDISRAIAIWRLVRRPSLAPSSTPMGFSLVVSDSYESRSKASSSRCFWYMWILSTGDMLIFSISRMQSCSTSLKPHFWASSRIDDHCSGVAL